MSTSCFIRIALIAVFALLAPRTFAQPQVVDSAFTYQGELRGGGLVSNGPHEFRFELFANASGSGPIGTPVDRTLVVTGGRFQTTLDFGDDAFNGSKRWLRIGVRAIGGEFYETLAPLQEVKGSPFTIARRMRSIVIPGNAMHRSPTSAQITTTQWGPQLSATAPAIGFSIPRPADWNSLEPFTVTLYFAVPTLTVSAIVNWRLGASSLNLNLPLGSANSGWDSLGLAANEDGAPVNIYPAPSRQNMMKSQTWTAHWSSTYQTWYFGTGVNTNNDFRGDPFWTFQFIRGSSVSGGNGEGYSQGLIVVSAEVQYPSI